MSEKDCEMKERMIRINECRQCQECIRAFKDDVREIPDDCPLERAPPKDWTPKCFGEYHTAFSDCRDCIWQKECDEYETVKEKASIVPPPSAPPDVPPRYIRKM